MEEEEELSQVCKSTMSRLCCRQQVFIGEKQRRASEDQTSLEREGEKDVTTATWDVAAAVKAQDTQVRLQLRCV